ncbi:alkaline phosphatase family protein [Actinomycetospora sp. TBRC 11914]|uniref:alkaline phosphatase family protein n=1 Tax=Actinomycetospora sp. TBRC 11914 TaxID=2729387 RepID=UPI00145C74DC|nr:alkaline phosphatase family protein [Actinomycetospora sp. TBRC 11914]NMO89360.1 phosphoglycerate mutase [Actinomycetospora sp. TBRC 11914]
MSAPGSRPPGWGETQPRLVDDRLPVVLVVLDGLGDRPVPELGGRTPAEAAHTPALDALAARGCSGWHLPFGWGRAPASELAHWAMFGFAEVPFPGRAVLEALGAGVDVPRGTAVTHAALRSSTVGDDGRVWITGRVASDARDAADAAALLEVLAPVVARHGAELVPLGGRGEALLVLHGHADGAVTDSDPFFEDRHPWLRVLACSPESGPGGGAGGGADSSAEVLNALLHDTRDALRDHPVNRARWARPPLDVLTTKWSGTRAEVPGFVDRSGVAGAAVTSTRLYRGLARLLGMAARHLAPVADAGEDLAARLASAEDLIAAGARFVHVHTKATDDAGHTKEPRAKLEVLEAADPGLAGLLDLADRAVVAVTGDHATPSTGGVLHTGDPTPLVVAGPTVRPDPVTAFGEGPAASGWYGTVRAAELLPLLFGHANRPVFLGHRATARRTLALPDDPEPMLGADVPGAVTGAPGTSAGSSAGAPPR